MRVIDLVRELPRAEKRPATAPFEVTEHIFSSDRHASIAAPAPSRIVWTLRMPARGTVRTWVALIPADGSVEAAATLRLGVSDDRRYDPLAQLALTTSQTARQGWIALSADVSLYGGWQWSLFHRPDRREWRLVFSADYGGGAGRVLWGAPGIDTDQEGARAWWRTAGGR